MNKHITRDETIKNYEKNSKQIMELAAYFWKVKPDSNEIFLMPSKNGYTISIAEPDWAISPDKLYNAGRDMQIGSVKMDSMLKILGWSSDTVYTLKEMLNNTNCISISSNGDYLQLDYGRDDICSFCYFIFKKPFPDSIIEKDRREGVSFLSKHVRIGSACAL